MQNYVRLRISIVLILLNPGWLFAQNPAPGQPVGVDVAAIQKQTEDLRAKANEFRHQLAALPSTSKSEPAEEPRLRPDEAPPEGSIDLSVDALKAKVDTLTARLTESKQGVDARAEKDGKRTRRMAALPQLILASETALAASTPPISPQESATDQEKADYQLSVANRAKAEQELLTFKAELALYQTETRNAPPQTDEVRRQALLEKSLKSWQAKLDRARLDATKDAATSAQERLENFSGTSGAKVIAAEIAKLAREHGGVAGLSGRMSMANTRQSGLEAQRARISKQHASAIRRVNLLEGAKLPIDRATGQLLRIQKSKLTAPASTRDSLREVLRDQAEAQLRQFALENRSAELAVEPAGDAPELQRSRIEHLDSLLADYRSYIATLNGTASSLRSLATETHAFEQFIDARLLWIRSAEPMHLSEPGIEIAAVRKLFSERPFAPLVADARRYPILWGFAIVVAATLALRRRRYITRLTEFGKAAIKRNCTSYIPTAKALGYTFLIAAPIPLLALFIHSRADGLSMGIADGLRNAGGFLLTSLVLATVARPHGLMVDHFRLAEERVTPLRSNLAWFVPVLPGLIFFATALPLKATSGSDGRLFFVALLVCLMIFFYRILRPSKKLITWKGKHPNHLARACFALGLVAPAALIAGAVSGFFASVQELRFQSLVSLWTIMLALFVAALIHRWLLVSRRRFAVHQALARRSAALAARKAAAKGKPDTKPQNVISQEEAKTEALKVVEVEEQTGRLVRAATITLVAFALWGIWKPTVPALSAMDKVTLWQTEADAPAENNETRTAKQPTSPLPSLPGVTTSPSDRTETANAPERVTLQDLATALVIFLLTIIAAKNIPGLLELTVFRRMRLRPGSSFAFTTTIRYLIVLVGVVSALAMLDITWGKVQWIAAAITLGIGFGLQEIFANFVAGLIILFERPIRLGDVVTVDDASGRVTQIRIRATTIRQFNSRELVVPNKEFITGKLVNWTLSDSILRFEIIVGIAYGSDTKKATEILLQIARACPKVLTDPAPDVLFNDFGESALLFELRAHVGHIEDLNPARNELRYGIDDAFKEAGIEIAFPQADIHLRSTSEPLQIIERTPDTK